ncbi:monovalent cation/H(+) antiporter subunit G [Rhizorhabdus dicambivorans]|uniref:Cation:proton antiporter n=1 Tax=Rhizorhabdus dicambivorans TaxID=1850238 RepID=A0A2A4FQH8_9SPHN|nr:monovalent cation/H(+) antiporter subunit G [Rhizorhabdus dicambivorans]ATE66379.1 cation:proton antiporter [Rhizorhabdus dicambivorans]PCE40379.1 cation:proton antiporter [Rhizorhabdus dicambivorans]
MSQAPDLPAWAALIVGIFVLLGASITLIGVIGLIRLGSFYDRVHPPTLGPTLGTACILVSSITCFSVLQSRPVVHEILIAVFVTLTTPVTLMLLARAALYRDRREDVPDVPRD